MPETERKLSRRKYTKKELGLSTTFHTTGPVEEAQPLSVRSDMLAIVRAMARPDSGLEVRDRLWLKIVIPSAFIGSEVVDWLHNRVQGLEERRDARKLASQLLRNGYIRHTVNKYTFSEQCYYVFGDLCLGELTFETYRVIEYFV